MFDCAYHAGRCCRMENRIPYLKTKIKKEIKNYLHEVDKNLTIIADIVKEDDIFQNIIIYDSYVFLTVYDVICR